MGIGKLLGLGLLGAVLVAGAPATSEAEHRHDQRCDHGRGRRDSRNSEYRNRRSYSSDRYYDSRRGGYGRVDYDAPYVARHGSGRGSYYSAPRGYYDGHGYYDARPYRRQTRAYHFHGRSRCYRSHASIGIHLHLR